MNYTSMNSVINDFNKLTDNYQKISDNLDDKNKKGIEIANKILEKKHYTPQPSLNYYDRFLSAESNKIITILNKIKEIKRITKKIEYLIKKHEYTNSKMLRFFNKKDKINSLENLSRHTVKRNNIFVPENSGAEFVFQLPDKSMSPNSPLLHSPFNIVNKTKKRRTA